MSTNTKEREVIDASPESNANLLLTAVAARSRANRGTPRAANAVRYKVSRGYYRTRAETREILDLPSSAPLPAFVCKLPDKALAMMRFVAAQKTLERMAPNATSAEEALATLDAEETATLAA